MKLIRILKKLMKADKIKKYPIILPHSDFQIVLQSCPICHGTDSMTWQKLLNFKEIYSLIQSYMTASFLFCHFFFYLFLIMSKSIRSRKLSFFKSHICIILSFLILLHARQIILISRPALLNSPVHLPL